MQDSKDYRMSQYLEDFGLFFAHIQGRLQASQSRGLSFGLFRSASPKRIHLVGTSMGGLLAMFFARYSSTTITSVVLNDVGCLLPWTSILGLMTEMQSVTKGSNLLGQTQDLARALDVDPRLLRAVQAPQHLDLPHETTLQGVDFGGVFQEVTLPILVLRGEDSEILNAVAAKHLMNCHPNTTIVSVPRAGHPVPYSDSVCKNMLSFCMRQDMDTKAQ
jgi:pimeloyl-ACP methyl ester carboxylesterase